MTVRIRQIEAEGLGPLATFSQGFQSFNLIYSPNEGGKTLLTEFVVTALFRRHWNTRIEGRGKVHLEGLSPDTLAFSPATRRKVEDHLAENEGLPPDLARLLVVKGSEPQIPGAHNAVDKETLRSFLSEQRMLNQITEAIPRTVQAAAFEDGTLAINRQGKGRDLKALEVRLNELNEQVRQVDENYATGRLQELQQQITATDEALAAQQKAKQYRAYQLNEKLKTAKQTLDHYDPEVLSGIERDIRDYEKAGHALKEAEQAYHAAKADAAHYQWLQQVREHYQALKNGEAALPHKGWLIAGALALISAMVGLIVQLTAITWISLLLMAFFTGFYLYRYQQTPGTDKTELAALRQRFYEETHATLGSLADVDARLENFRQAPSEEQRLSQVIADQQAERQQLATRIQQAFYRLNQTEPPPEDWQDQLNTLRRERQAAQEQYDTLQAQLAELGVAASDYTASPAGVAYSAEQMSNLQEERQSLAEQLEAEEQGLTDLQSEIGALTGQNLAKSPFNQAYEALLAEREQVQAQLTDLKGEVIAGKLLTDLVEDLKQTDDQKIADALASDYLQRPLQALTGRYHGLKLDANGSLMVQDRLADYKVTDLSTGAYEQVMLALRAGISARLLRDQQLFLWLDDALQHTDWQKRPDAIRYLADLAMDGWQITYLTMDDHIRDTFDQIGQEKLPGRYQRIDLANEPDFRK